MAILTLSQTSCLRLLKCRFSLGKLYGGDVRPRVSDGFVDGLIELKVGDPF